MRLRIEQDGHQESRINEGELLAWSTITDRWDREHFVCPCAIIQTDSGAIEVVTIREYRMNVRMREVSARMDDLRTVDVRRPVIPQQPMPDNAYRPVTPARWWPRLLGRAE